MTWKNDVFAYNISKINQNLFLYKDDDFWEQISPAKEPPRPRCRHTAAIHKSNMYVFGGNDNEKSFNDMYIL